MILLFVHSLCGSDNHANFQYIYNYLTDYEDTCCVMNKCEAFIRSYRDRNNEKQKTQESKSNEMNEHDIVRQQITDKVHCFLCHSFDVGMRLNLKQKLIIYDDQSIDDLKLENNDNNVCLMNKQLTQIRDTLNDKTKHLKMRNDEKSRLYKKYQQLNEYMQENEQTTNKTFHFGLIFKYGNIGGFDDEHHEAKTNTEQFIHTNTGDKYVKISNKFPSLKTELTDNGISILTMQQFAVEMHKAKLHYNTFYCKKKYHSMKSGSLSFSIEYTLSLMVYCNFDDLQYEFSKTYRENDGKAHENFFWLGRNLKIVVQKFGNRVKDGQIKKFYHGIRETLQFPQYMGDMMMQ
eukprot:392577_1